MASTVATVAAPSHRKRLETVSTTMAKADLNKVAEWKRRIGAIVQRAFKLANLTQDEVAGKLGHEHGAQVSRWIAGTERPQFDQLFAIRELQQPLVEAFATLPEEGISITTQITVTRKVASR